MTMTCTPGMPAPIVEEFERLAKMFERSATEIDGIALEIMAANMAQWRRSVRDVEENGIVVMSGGIAMANPAIAVGERAQSQIRSMIADLGISASFKRKMAGASAAVVKR